MSWGGEKCVFVKERKRRKGRGTLIDHLLKAGFLSVLYICMLHLPLAPQIDEIIPVLQMRKLVKVITQILYGTVRA